MVNSKAAQIQLVKKHSTHCAAPQAQQAGLFEPSRLFGRAVRTVLSAVYLTNSRSLDRESLLTLDLDNAFRLTAARPIGSAKHPQIDN